MEPSMPLEQSVPCVDARPQPPWQRTLYTTWIAQLLSIMGVSFVLPFMPFYIRELGVKTEGQVAVWSGLAITASGVMFAIFSPIWGTLADRYGRKIMVERAMFSGALILALMGTVHNVYQLLALRMLQGMLTGTIVACTTLVTSIAPRGRLGFVLGLQQVAVLAGNSLGPWLGGILADHWGYRMPFFGSGLLLLVGGVIVLVGAHESFTRPADDPNGNHGLQEAFGRAALIAVLAVFFFISFSMSFAGPIFPLFVEKIAVGLRPASMTGLLIGITGVAAGISAIVVGRMSDRVGHRRLLVASTFSSGVIAMGHALARSVGQLFGLRVAAGLAAGGTAPTLNAVIATSVSPDMYGRAYGLTQSASGLGWAIGPLVGGVIASAVGLRWPFAIMGLLLMLSAALVWSFVRSERSAS